MPAAIAQFTIIDYNDITVGATAPASPSIDQLWLNTSVTPNRLSRWSGSAWVLATPTTPGQVGAEATIYKQASAPAHSNGRLWLQTGIVPNILWRSTGSAWEKVTPTTPGEIGAYPSEDGSNLENRVYSAEQKMTPEAIVNTFTEEYSKNDTKAITKGIVTMNREGINVGTSESGIKSYMLYNGFEVRDNNEAVAVFGESSAVIPKLYVGDLINPKVLQKAPVGTYTVGLGGTFLTLQEALDWLFKDGRRFLDEQVLLNVYGNQNGNLLIKEIYGGTLIIRLMDGAKIYGWVMGQDLYTSLTIESGGTGRGGVIVSDWPFTFNRCMNVKVQGLDIKGSTLNFFATASNLVIRDCDVGSNNCYYGYIAQDGANIIAVNNRGRVTGQRAETRNGVIHQFGEVMQYALGNGDSNTGGSIINTNIVPTASTYAVPAVTSKTFTRVFSAATIDTLHNGSTVDSYYGAQGVQNRWTGMSGYKIARFRLDNAISAFITGGSNISIRMRLRRASTTHGSSNAVIPTPANFACTMTGALRGGWSGWGAISSSYFGTAPDFRLGSNVYSNYAIWDAIEIEVTVTKTL